MIAIIDYGMGNLRSVQKALERVGGKGRLTSKRKDVASAEKIVLPGVGAFGDAMKELKHLGLVAPIKEAIAEGRTFLGLCLGMQLLFETSEESKGVKGFGIFKGRVRRFRFPKGDLKVPHMGWNNIVVSRQSLVVSRPEILRGLPDGAYMYFVHSYYVEPKDKTIILATTDYGKSFVSAIHKDNVYGFQFHPEKSQALGLQLLANFVGL
jgi:glutamine amidotransferase